MKMRDEYDFSKGVRGKYAKEFSEGTNLVLLEPDVAEYFTDAKAVNHALRKLIKEDVGAKSDSPKEDGS